MKRSARWWPALLLVALVGSACSSPPVRKVQPEAETKQPGALTSIRLLGNADPVMDAAISAFYAKYPDYRIERVPYASGTGSYADRVQTQLSQGEADVAPVQTPRTLVEAGVLLPLDPLIQRAKSDLSGVTPLLDQMRIGGKLYELPYTAAPVVLTYNQDRFHAAGVPEPRAGWTWDQFREAALHLSDGVGENRQWGFGTIPGDPQLVSMYLAGKSGNRLSQVDDRTVSEGLQFFSTLVFSDKAMPVGPPAGVSLSPVDLFTQGKAAMGLAQLPHVALLGNLPFRWDVAPIPAHPGARPATLTYVQSLGIAANAKNPDAAFAFLQFLTGPEGARVIARAGALPAWRSPEVQRAWLDHKPGPPPGAAASLEMDWLVAPRGVDQSAAGKRLEALSDAVDQTLSGERSWEQAFEQYHQAVAQIKADTK